MRDGGLVVQNRWVGGTKWWVGGTILRSKKGPTRARAEYFKYSNRPMSRVDTTTLRA